MSSEAARSTFIFPENRLRLAHLLRRNGFKVRMHGYEYLVAYGSMFLCLILLQPSEGTVLIREFKWIKESSKLVERIVGLIRTLDAASRIIVY